MQSHQEYITKKYSKIISDKQENNNRDQSFGFVDCSYSLSLDHKSAINLSKTFKLIRQMGDFEPRKHYLLNNYWSDLYKLHNDHKNTEVIPRHIQMGYAEDRVVFSGLERIAKLITGKSSTYFNYYGIGTGTAEVLPSDTGLQVQEARVPIDTTGFAESKGSTIQFAAVFPTTIPSFAVSESAIFDARFDPSTMLLRTVYTGSNVINHVINQTYIAISHIIYLISV